MLGFVGFDWPCVQQVGSRNHHRLTSICNPIRNLTAYSTEFAIIAT